MTGVNLGRQGFCRDLADAMGSERLDNWMIDMAHLQGGLAPWACTWEGKEPAADSLLSH